MKGVKDGGKGDMRRPGTGYEEGWDRIFNKQEKEMKDETDQRTIDWVDDEEDEFAGIDVPELNFNDNPCPWLEEEEICPCCAQHLITQDVINCQVEGETCTYCNFHTWEDYS